MCVFQNVYIRLHVVCKRAESQHKLILFRDTAQSCTSICDSHKGQELEIQRALHDVWVGN